MRSAGDAYQSNTRHCQQCGQVMVSNLPVFKHFHHCSMFPISKTPVMQLLTINQALHSRCHSVSAKKDMTCAQKQYANHSGPTYSHIADCTQCNEGAVPRRRTNPARLNDEVTRATSVLYLCDGPHPQYPMPAVHQVPSTCPVADARARRLRSGWSSIYTPAAVANATALCM